MGCNDKDKICTKSYDKDIVLQHGKLSPQEFLQYFDSKVFKTIKKYQLIDRTEKICVAASGGKDSTAALYLTKKYFDKYGIDPDNLFAIVIDEGIERHRDESLKNLKQFCEKEEIKLIIVNVKDNFKTNIDESANKIREIGHGITTRR